MISRTDLSPGLIVLASRMAAVRLPIGLKKGAHLLLLSLLLLLVLVKPYRAVDALNVEMPSSQQLPLHHAVVQVQEGVLGAPFAHVQTGDFQPQAVDFLVENVPVAALRVGLVGVHLLAEVAENGGGAVRVGGGSFFVGVLAADGFLGHGSGGLGLGDGGDDRRGVGDGVGVYRIFFEDLRVVG